MGFAQIFDEAIRNFADLGRNLIQCTNYPKLGIKHQCQSEIKLV